MSEDHIVCELRQRGFPGTSSSPLHVLTNACPNASPNYMSFTFAGLSLSPYHLHVHGNRNRQTMSDPLLVALPNSGVCDSTTLSVAVDRFSSRKMPTI